MHTFEILLGDCCLVFGLKSLNKRGVVFAEYNLMRAVDNRPITKNVASVCV